MENGKIYSVGHMDHQRHLFLPLTVNLLDLWRIRFYPEPFHLLVELVQKHVSQCNNTFHLICLPLCLMTVFYYKIVKFVNEHSKNFLLRNSTPKQFNTSDGTNKAPKLTESAVQSEIATNCKFVASKPHVGCS